LRDLWDEIGGDVAGAFGELEDAGHLEIVTVGATPANPPPGRGPAARAAQIQTAPQTPRRPSAKSPPGTWLPEAGHARGGAADRGGGGSPFLVRRRAGAAAGGPAPAVRHGRARLRPQRRGGVRARPGVVEAGVVGRRGLPRRPRLPRLLPRRRLRPAARRD